MSYTEIFKFNCRGNAECIGEINNSWRGAAAVWGVLEKKYLIPYFPSWGTMGESYTRLGAGMSNPSLIQEIWDLANDDRLSNVEKIVLCSTFDKVIVMRKDIDKLLDAFDKFEGETSLKEQAQVIRYALKEDPKLMAIAWNQTSVNSDAWVAEDKRGNYRLYNIKKDSDHWSLFEELELKSE